MSISRIAYHSIMYFCRQFCCKFVCTKVQGTLGKRGERPFKMTLLLFDRTTTAILLSFARSHCRFLCAAVSSKYCRCLMVQTAVFWAFHDYRPCWCLTVKVKKRQQDLHNQRPNVVWTKCMWPGTCPTQWCFATTAFRTLS